jgi:negative regulator of flagellin synthesis FlgM
VKVTGTGPKNVAVNGTSASGEAAKISRTGKPGASPGAEALGSAARVDVSSRAQEMKRAKELATPSKDIDEAKVARLQSLIDSGKYKMDAAAIADRLVDEQMKMPE